MISIYFSILFPPSDSTCSDHAGSFWLGLSAAAMQRLLRRIYLLASEAVSYGRMALLLVESVGELGRENVVKTRTTA